MTLVNTSSLTGRFAQLLAIAACLVLAIWLLAPSVDFQEGLNVPGTPWSRPKLGSPPSSNVDPAPPPIELKQRPNHPIDSLIRSANLEFDQFLAKETHNLRDAAQAYRERRGRQPPPLFNEWFEFAQSHNVIMIEDMFDQIYHDLNPFWGKPAKEIRNPAVTFKPRISVRDGIVHWYHPWEKQSEWSKLWSKLIGTFAERLPDVDIPINVMDESRMVVEWEEINEYMQRGHETRRIVPEEQLKDSYSSLAYLEQNPPEVFKPQWVGMGPYWQKAVVGCPPESPARKYYIESDFSNPPPLTGEYPAHSFEGYVRNWTIAKSPCDNPHLQGLHGTFIEPLSMQHTKKFWPLFGGSKLPVNNEILLPAAMYWTDDPFYSGGNDHGEAWRAKKDRMIWRGVASGGRNKKENWTRFQRHRFLSMINATSVRTAEFQSDDAPPNFVLPVDEAYRLAATSPGSNPGDLSDWVKTWGDGAFVSLLCFPKTPPPNQKKCEYTDAYYSVKDLIPMSDQYNYKYLPDVDGNSFSGRYRGFLSSTSLPIKATIYQEWHDSRLIPWKHFVPMDNTFIDIYGIMEYFLGNRAAGVLGHDEEAKNIALGGKDWADKVLRHEDMQVYVYRLLLEYARLCDDDREKMGWKEDYQPEERPPDFA